MGSGEGLLKVHRTVPVCVCVRVCERVSVCVKER